MQTKGIILVGFDYEADPRHTWIESEEARGKFLQVMDIAVDKSSYLCIIGGNLVDIPKRYAAIFLPFKKQDGIIVPLDISMTEQMVYLSEVHRYNVQHKPQEQLKLLHKKFPHYWEQEKNGELYPNGVHYIYANLSEMMKHKQA